MMVITLQHQIIGVSMVGSFHGFHQVLWRGSPGGGIWTIGLNCHWVRADWPNGTYGIGCGFTNAGSMAYYEPKNGDEIQQGHEEPSFTT